MLFFNKLIKDDAVRERVENIFLYASVFLISVLLEPFQEGAVEICVFKNVTNLPCPGCGMTRSFVYAGHLDLYNSFLMNPFGLILFFFWGWSALKDLIWLLFKKNLPFPPEKLWNKSKIWFIIGLVTFGVIRMGFYINDFEPFQPFIKLVNQLKQYY